MAKRKFNVDQILKAGEDAHLKTTEKHIYGTPINGETFQELNVDDISNNPMQPRLRINEDELEELKRSIRLHGLIQPISVISVGEGKYILKAGQRRWMAHKSLGLKKIKAIVQEEVFIPNIEKEKALFEIAVLENISRDDLLPLELGLAIKNALAKNIYKNPQEVSNGIGKSKSYVSKLLKILLLREEIIEDIRKNKSTNDTEALYEIQKIKDPKKQIEVYFDFISGKIDRKALREMNSKLVKKADDNYIFNQKGNKVNLLINMSRLSKEKAKEMNRDLDELLKKYFKGR